VTDSALTIDVLPALSAIAPEAWNRLSQSPFQLMSREKSQEPQARREDAESGAETDESECELAESPSEEDDANPFLTHAFLSALEDSGSVGGRTGWTPLHLVARSSSGVIGGAMPVYAKGHSRGEYVFDHAFAEAYHRAGGAYYPKLQISVPFTPATGRRLLVPPGANAAAIRQRLLASVENLRAKLDASSIHATFLTPRDRSDFLAAGFLERNDQQFHFDAGPFRDFEDFLASLASRKRKGLKRERREALAAGISVEWLTGSSLMESHWDAFFAFYQETGNRKWGSPYLTRRFFSLIGERMPERVLLVMARRAGRHIAGALNFIGANTLYGRTWGAIEHHPFLHFELCYYQAIDFALQHGLARVEAGAQGEHKLARGYRPVKTISVHRFADHGFQQAVGAYLARERLDVDEAQTILERMTPFRKGG
jgi:hypothetical protein